MNAIRATQKLNEQELKEVIPPTASWHRDYDDTAFIYIGGLHTDLSEGDVITIFSQYGEPVFINLVRDKETGKSKGFCFIKYEDQRSCALAVDNLGGATVLGRVLRVDHTRYKVKEGEEIYDNTRGEANGNTQASETEAESEEDQPKRPLLKEEKELQKLLQEGDDEDDPMKAFLIQQKREEVEIAKAKAERREKKERRHRSTRDEDGRERRKRHDPKDEDRNERRRRHKDDSDEEGRKERRRRRDSSEEGSRERRKHRRRSRSPRKNARNSSDRIERSPSKTPVYGE
jgi:RNA-binding motif X-linked protein 2